jgi:ATP-binding cassette subfamily B (MDR/TAP) protein 1
VVLSKGKIVEQGTHEDLLSKKGAYHSLLHSQGKEDPDDETNDQFGSIDEGDDPFDFYQALRRIDSIGQQQDAWASTDSLFPLTFNKTPNLKIGHSADQRLIHTDTDRPEEIHTEGLWTLIRFLASLNHPEMLYMIIGLICSVLGGMLSIYAG